MRIVSESAVEGVAERQFELAVAGERVPGVLWTPEDADEGRPLVLMGHGGSQNKLVPSLVARARRYVRAYGYAVAAIDAPGHGDRVSAAEAAATAAAIARRISERRGLGGEALQAMSTRAQQAVPEWIATLDELQELKVVGADGPIGYWGVSMGTVIGVPLLAAEPRINAAVLGLAGLAPGHELMAQSAAAIRIPVEFVFQWGDELVSREAGIALFDALASTEKTMHINPGGHVAIPPFELASWERFFVRHLGR